MCKEMTGGQGGRRTGLRKWGQKKTNGGKISASHCLSRCSNLGSVWRKCLRFSPLLFRSDLNPLEFRTFKVSPKINLMTIFIN